MNKTVNDQQLSLSKRIVSFFFKNVSVKFSKLLKVELTMCAQADPLPLPVTGPPATPVNALSAFSASSYRWHTRHMFEVSTQGMCLRIAQKPNHGQYRQACTTKTNMHRKQTSSKSRSSSSSMSFIWTAVSSSSLTTLSNCVETHNKQHSANIFDANQEHGGL